MYMQRDVSLKPYTTFAVDVTASWFVTIEQENDILELIHSEIFASYPHIILWWGANILFTKNYEGLVIKVSLLGKHIVYEDETTVHIKVGAWENRHDTMMRSLTHGYVGWENLVLIPGQVGAAPVGNIGAYGKEAKDIIYEVEGIDLVTQEKHTRTNQACCFGYRTSIFKQQLSHILITSVTFVFTKQTTNYLPTIQYNDIQQRIADLWKDASQLSALEVAQLIIAIRENKLPDRTQLWTAGSFFKNPVIDTPHFQKLLQTYPSLTGNTIQDSDSSFAHVKLSAWQLIELAWFKWCKIGSVGTYDRHALIIVNYGGATWPEIWAFAESIQKKVLDMFGVHLEPEVIIV